MNSSKAEYKLRNYVINMSRARDKGKKSESSTGIEPAKFPMSRL